MASLVALAIVIAGYAWLTQHYTVVSYIEGSDSWAHFTAIRRTLERGPFAGDIYFAGEPAPTSFYSLAHILLAGVAMATGMAPHEAFVGAQPWIAALDLIAVSLWLYLLTGDARVAVAGAAVELMVSIVGPAWIFVGAPRYVALFPLYLSWSAYLRWRDTAGWPWLVACGVSVGLCAATHLLVGMLCGVGIVLQEVALGWGERRRWLAVGVVALLGAVVASPWLYVFASGTLHRPEKLHRQFLNNLDTTPLPGLPSVQVLSPSLLDDIVPGPLWLAIAAGVVVAATRFRASALSARDAAAARYALIALAIALALTLTPLFKLVTFVLGSWSARVILIAPFSLLFGLGVARLFDLAGGHVGSATVLLRLTAAVVLLWIAFAGVASLYDTSARNWGLGQLLLERGPIGGWDLEARLRAAGPLPTVVLTDPETGYVLPYLTGVNVVAITPGHGSISVDHRRRVADVETFFTPTTPQRSLERILDRYGVDAVAINPTSKWPTPGASAALLERLRSRPGFADTNCCGELVVLRYEKRVPPVGRKGSANRREPS